jgi:hypothetical protein
MVNYGLSPNYIHRFLEPYFDDLPFDARSDVYNAWSKYVTDFWVEQGKPDVMSDLLAAQAIKYFSHRVITSITPMTVNQKKPLVRFARIAHEIACPLFAMAQSIGEPRDPLQDAKDFFDGTR